MLENLARRKSLTSMTAPTRFRSRAAFAGALQRGALELARCPPRALFPAVKRVTEHSCDRFFPAQKMHLKTVCLFFCAHLRVNAANVLFRIRIRSSSHVPCLTTTSNNGVINESRFFCLAVAFFPVRAGPRSAIFFRIHRLEEERNTGASSRETN